MILPTNNKDNFSFIDEDGWIYSDTEDEINFAIEEMKATMPDVYDSFKEFLDAVVKVSKFDFENGTITMVQKGKEDTTWFKLIPANTYWCKNCNKALNKRGLYVFCKCCNYKEKFRIYMKNKR